jgi:hypothetical protein
METGLFRLSPILAGLIVACTFAVALPERASAQTCIAPEPLQLSPANRLLGSETCAGEPAGLRLCNGNVITTAPSHVFSLYVGAGNNATLTLGGGISGFDPYMYLTSGGRACGAGSCLQSAGTLSLRDVAPGEHLLVVTQTDFDAPGACGTFILSLSGDLGDADSIMADGFD